jgi:hypothetical protein
LERAATADYGGNSGAYNWTMRSMIGMKGFAGEIVFALGVPFLGLGSRKTALSAVITVI